MPKFRNSYCDPFEIPDSYLPAHHILSTICEIQKIL